MTAAQKSEAPVIGPTEASDVKNPAITQGINMSDSTAVQVSSQPVFSFGDHQVRVVLRDGDPWFVASDVCAALDYRNTSKAVADHLDDDERMTLTAGYSQSGGGERSNEQLDRTGTGGRRGGARFTVVINESGLYALVLRSRKPEARKFAKWVTSEVLPAIRKTGVYVGKPFAVNPTDVLTAGEQDALRSLLQNAASRLPKDEQAKFMVQGWSKLKSHFGVGYREIPRGEFTTALSIVSRHEVDYVVELEPARWERETVNQQVARLARGLDDANGYMVETFMPLYEVIQAKLARKGKAKQAMDTGAALEASGIIAARVQRRIFDQLMASGEWKHERWLMSFDFSREGAQPSLTNIADSALVASLPEIAKMIVEPGGMLPSNDELMQLGMACMQRLQGRMGMQPASGPALAA